ncbi:hypothetical protein ES703_24798 [subsurface metagenome]
MPDEPIDYGVTCTHCPGLSPTPKYMYARFSLIIKCTGLGYEQCKSPPNDRPFKLTQVTGTPCSWYYLSGDWNVYYSCWSAVDGKARLKIEDNLSQAYFEETVLADPDEGIVWHNTLGCVPGLICGSGGIGIITWNPQATELLKNINMKKARDLFMELRPLEDGKLVYKFCRLQDATNISILFEP